MDIEWAWGQWSKKRGSMRQGKGVGVWGECSLTEGGVSRTGVLDSGAWVGRMGE